jgi:hypothetical protein
MIAPEQADVAYPQEVAMDALTLIILTIGAVLVLRALFPSARGVDYVVVEIQRAPQRLGCMPILVALLAAMLLLALLGGRQ